MNPVRSHTTTGQSNNQETVKNNKFSYSYIRQTSNWVKVQDLRKKDKKELEKSVQDLRKKLGDIRFKFSSNKLKNVKEISNTKKEIARILTILKEKK